MISAEQARELLDACRAAGDPFDLDAMIRARTLLAGRASDLAKTVIAQAEQIARVEAFAQRFQEAAKKLRDGPAKTISDAHRHGLKADEYDYFATSLRHALGGQP